MMNIFSFTIVVMLVYCGYMSIALSYKSVKELYRATLIMSIVTTIILVYSWYENYLFTMYIATVAVYNMFLTLYFKRVMS